MTKIKGTPTTREIKHEKNADVFNISLLMAIIISTFFSMITGIILYNMTPHEVCETTENVEMITLSRDLRGIEYPLETEIMCEEGVEVSTYDALGYKMIWTYWEDIGKICMIKTKEEICRWE